MHKIDFAFISKREGGQLLSGYVPAASTSKSGVTIATGFDIGARNENDLKRLGLSAALVQKLKPYLGKQRGDASALLVRSPLKVTKLEADEIDRASHKSAADALIASYDRAIAAKGRRIHFEQLFPEAQTVMASVAFQYGSLELKTKKFWAVVTDQDWRGAIGELRNFGDAYGPRRKLEADLLDHGLHTANSVSGTKGGLATSYASIFTNILGTFGAPAALGAGAVGDKKTIAGSVGRGGKNQQDDVRVVQRLLNAYVRVPYSLLPVDGHADNRLTEAIVDFQRRYVGLPSPDGRVDPGGKTIGMLGKSGLKEIPGASGGSTANSVPASTAAQTTVASTSALSVKGGGPRCFPFPVVTKWSWEEGSRAFGSNRDGGARAHAGCDLYYPTGTVIHAVADGKVIRGPYAFYCQTFALEVDHGDFVVRYGEIGSALVREGDEVKMGQKIAKVGHLVGIKVASDMLHFEMYAGAEKGALNRVYTETVKRTDGIPFYRRGDLIDPTPYLNEWKKNLPIA